MHKETLLAHATFLSPKRMTELLGLVSSPEELFRLPDSFFTHLPWKETLKSKWHTFRHTVKEDILEDTLRKTGCTAIPQSDNAYPAAFRDLYDPPLAVFVRGKLVNTIPLVAFVGSRKSSPYGRMVTTSLVTDLVRHGVGIVSGLALGIDSVAHECAITHGGYTIGVLGSGPDKDTLYPRQHVSLSEDMIAKGGAILAEYPPLTKATTYTFPARNRLIAALAQVTIIVEAAERSGALITASVATDLHREVGAIPHSIMSDTGIGPHRLIKEGAHLITCVDDILLLLGLPSSTKKEALVSKPSFAVEATPTEIIIMKTLDATPTHIDEITQVTGLPGQVVSSTLTLLEIQGAVQHMGGMLYIRRVLL